MSAPNRIVDLRALLAERFPSPAISAASHFSTGISSFDQLVGGLPKGAITELISPHFSAGSAGLIAALLETLHHSRSFLALIDGADSFDPTPLGNLRLRNLLWVRCRQSSDAVKAADFLLRDGNFPLVILDLVLNEAAQLRNIPQMTWYRLQRLVEQTTSAFLILTRQNMIGSAQLKLVLENKWALPDLGQDRDTSRLKLRVQRAHRQPLQIAQAV